MTYTFEQDLEAALNALLKPDSFFPAPLFDSIRYSVRTPGKRIRPRIALATGQMLGLTREEVLPAAIAIEWLHCFTLIHDDLPCMDNDDWRRGLPSNHKKFGEATALLAGDSLVPMAVELLLAAPVDPQLKGSATSALMKCIGPRGVMGGQALEEQLTEDSTLAQVQRVHDLKTGALFRACVEVPMCLKGIAEDSHPGRTLLDFALTLGRAFQIADDLEDAQPFLSETSTVKKQELRKSILRFTPASEAAKLAQEGLHASRDSLLAHWKSDADGLLQILQEVELKLTGAVRA